MEGNLNVETYAILCCLSTVTLSALYVFWKYEVYYTNPVEFAKTED